MSNRPYGVSESLIGFKRAAATHGWQVCLFYAQFNELFYWHETPPSHQIPVGIDKLVR